jgi:hypothetical protein
MCTQIALQTSDTRVAAAGLERSFKHRCRDATSHNCFLVGVAVVVAAASYVTGDGVCGRAKRLNRRQNLRDIHFTSEQQKASHH